MSLNLYRLSICWLLVETPETMILPPRRIGESIKHVRRKMPIKFSDTALSPVHKIVQERTNQRMNQIVLTVDIVKCQSDVYHNVLLWILFEISVITLTVVES